MSYLYESYNGNSLCLNYDVYVIFIPKPAVTTAFILSALKLFLFLADSKSPNHKLPTF
jgi:hypothetical protein